MHLTLLESDRNFFRTAECAFASIVAHAALVWLVVGSTQGGMQFPADEREARVFFLLPPDRVDVRPRQSEIFQLGTLGGDLVDAEHLARLSEDRRVSVPAYSAPPKLPFGPVSSYVPDTVFSVLEVDKMVERYEGSAAPVYPPDLIAIGTQGVVQATYVVDSTGRVDTTTIQVIASDDSRFTESVRTALGLMLFRPARRAGRAVRQLVQQQFRFQITPASEVARQSS
jgi:hypothetical protein